MNVGQAAHLSGQMSGQAAQMNQVGGSGVGVGGTDGLPQHQQMQDVVGLTGMDAHFLMMRNNMRQRIFEYIGYIGRKQFSAESRRRLPELSKRLEEILFRKFNNKTDYTNMMNGSLEHQLQFAIKALSAQSQSAQNQQAQQGMTQGTGGNIRMIPTPGMTQGTDGNIRMIPTPGMTQGTGGNTRIPYVTDNNALSSSGAGMVPHNANMGSRSGARNRGRDRG